MDLRVLDEIGAPAVGPYVLEDDIFKGLFLEALDIEGGLHLRGVDLQVGQEYIGDPDQRLRRGFSRIFVLIFRININDPLVSAVGVYTGVPVLHDTVAHGDAANKGSPQPGRLQAEHAESVVKPAVADQDSPPCRARVNSALNGFCIICSAVSGCSDFPDIKFHISYIKFRILPGVSGKRQVLPWNPFS